MKYAIIGDIHANLEALTAVLECAAAQNIDKYLCIGDIVGYNANPRECVELVRQLHCEVVIKGNHDEQASCDSELVGFNPQAARAIEWTREQLSTEQKVWLASLPYRRTCGSKVTLVHATLDMPHMWGYIFDRFSAGVSLGYQFTPLCFFGHTHVPLAFEKYGDVSGGKYTSILFEPGHKYMVNVGSVGQPRDGDPRAAFAIYDEEEQSLVLRRVEYDVSRSQEKILDARLPERLAQRLAYGR